MAAIEDYSALIVAATALLTLVWKHLGPDARTRDQAVRLEGRLARLETQISPFWKIIEENIPRLLKQPTHLHKDMLLDRMSGGKLSYDEAVELTGILRKELEGMMDTGKVLAIALVLARLAQMVEG